MANRYSHLAPPHSSKVGLPRGISSTKLKLSNYTNYERLNPLALESCSLKEMLLNDDLSSRWCDGRVIEKYRIIIRDIVMIFSKWESQNILGCHCGVDDIEILDGRVKISHSPSVELIDRVGYRDQLSSLVSTIVGCNKFIVELDHFYFILGQNAIYLKWMYYHPFLQSSEERFYFPLDVVMHLDNELRDWEHYLRYDNLTFKVAEIVSNEPMFNDVCQQGTYGTSTASALRYAKNVVTHVNEHARRKKQPILTQDDVEKRLANLFPGLFTRVFEFIAKLNVDFKFRRWRLE